MREEGERVRGGGARKGWKGCWETGVGLCVRQEGEDERERRREEGMEKVLGKGGGWA